MPLLKGQIFSANLIYTMLINRGDQMICDHCQQIHLLKGKKRGKCSHKSKKLFTTIFGFIKSSRNCSHSKTNIPIDSQ